MDEQPKKRGFAAMDPEKQRELARKGGKAAHEQGTAHQFDSAEAYDAGRKGGKAVSMKPGHMARIGRLGGIKRAANARNKGEAE